ncbi:MAG TPA: type II secretion system ATPase GspE [Candidatus Hydrogenedentes bacterium]|nr:type II secretion system ATPase GspE [Candidatus Hydrogenedentota bacterium]HPC17262.1 type II secretion system ATPase GspE [Candidatus Hydrogenedentota bacterium]HRT21177.1 type II secretion system ATPase GspE [Candidatus Hydrogenedentota bacterium]HRT65958.1 type II secretion system ATPase GspE [Candidatus Hydrogenedentota bacterium]
MASTQEQELAGILLELGYVHQEQINEALELQKIRPKRLDALLSDLGYVQEDHLLEALGRQYGMPFEPNIQKQVDTSLTTKVPINFIREYQMVPYQRNGAGYYVALHDPANLLPLDDLRLLLNGPVQPVLCRKADIQAIIDNYFEQQGESAADMIGTIAMSEEEGETAYQTLDALESERDLLDLANEAPIIRLINLLISGAVRERASDIHVEPFERDVRVRYRIDGVLYEKFVVPKSQQAAVTSRIKIMASLNIAEHRLPQDGRIKIRLSGKEIDIRVSVIPVAHGERVVMRILEKGNFLFSLEQLGMSKLDYSLVDKLITQSHGIILVTGPTGSGKSTTLYAALQRVNSPDKNIITVEDPIEYLMPGIGQIQVRPKIGLTFAAGLRHILRQDPDVILVGEIRDHETAEMAIQASLTGHLVFATLHTNDSAGAITRLINMGIEPFLVTSSTIAIMAQRLVRRICPECKEAYTPDPESLRDLGVSADMLGHTVYRGKGCERCQGRGYFGRTGIFELLVMTPRVQELTLKGVDSNIIKREAMKHGMRTLREDGAAKVALGMTTVEEILRVTRDDLMDEVME